MCLDFLALSCFLLAGSSSGFIVQSTVSQRYTSKTSSYKC